MKRRQLAGCCLQPGCLDRLRRTTEHGTRSREPAENNRGHKMQRDAYPAARMIVRVLGFSVLVVVGAAAPGSAQQPPPDGWVVIPVEDYRALRALAYPPTRP